MRSPSGDGESRWDAAAHQVFTARDSPLDHVNLAFDKSDNLMVVSYVGSGKEK